MPHVVLEVTDNLPLKKPKQLLKQVAQILAETAPCRLQDVKGRVYRCPVFCVGDGQVMGGFAHLTVRLLEGRDAARLRFIAQALLPILVEAFPDGMLDRPFDRTVEIVAMPKAGYIKA
jgi:5-carboxymethyl-2-hydroxymuconate isomerase